MKTVCDEVCERKGSPLPQRGLAAMARDHQRLFALLDMTQKLLFDSRAAWTKVVRFMIGGSQVENLQYYPGFVHLLQHC